MTSPSCSLHSLWRSLSSCLVVALALGLLTPCEGESRALYNTGEDPYKSLFSYWFAFNRGQDVDRRSVDVTRRHGGSTLGSEFLGRRKREHVKRMSGSEFLGKRAPGSEFLGKRAPGSEFLGKRAPGSEFLGKRAPGSEFLGKRAPGSEFLGKRAPGSEFLGKRAPGSEFLGKRAPGSEFLGKRAPGSEFLGKRAPGSEFLGKRNSDDFYIGKVKRSPEEASDDWVTSDRDLKYDQMLRQVLEAEMR